MAITVFYDTTFAYRYDERGESFPMLQIEVGNPADPRQVVTIDAYLDSGALRSLFQGDIPGWIGLDLLNGPVRKYVSTSGAELIARVHCVDLAHFEIGRFTLDIGFSTMPIRRNILGRDFFAFLQVGFHELHSTFHIARRP